MGGLGRFCRAFQLRQARIKVSCFAECRSCREGPLGSDAGKGML